MTVKFEKIASALMGLLEYPDAERPYLALADAYEGEGMEEEKKAVMFLAEKRFRRENDNYPDSHEKQRENNSKNAQVDSSP